MTRPWLAAVMLVSVGLGCRRPVPPAPTTTPPPVPAPAPEPPLPPEGILRLTRTGRPADDVLGNFTPVPGLPVLYLKLRYGGRKSGLEVEQEAWHNGKKLGTAESFQFSPVPSTGLAAWGFGQKVGSEGKPRVALYESVPARVGKDPSEGSAQAFTTQEYSVPPLEGRDCRTYEPAWPLEISDGEQAVFWGVFVDEPSDGPSAAALEERARRACTAWLLRIRLAGGKR